jgi:AraC-like DNA-binding protein
MSISPPGPPPLESSLTGHAGTADGAGRWLGSNLVALRLAAALHPRSFSLPGNLRGAARACIALTEGSGRFEGREPDVALSAPSVAWLPADEHAQLRVPAGAQGHLLWVSDTMVRASLGDHAESAQLRQVLDRPVVAGDLQSADAMADIEHACHAIERETHRSGGGSRVYLAAQLAILLVHCWRGSGLEDVAAKGFGADSTLLFRFRQLVEIHFRDHWRVARYAQALGISHDRLHDVCVRSLRRLPMQLIHERLTHEAAQRLLRSGFTIGQIASDLGFRSTAYFTQFFTRTTGTAPGRYRRAVAQARASNAPLHEATFADWP